MIAEGRIAFPGPAEARDESFVPGRFPCIPGSSVEVVSPPVRGKIRHALFDFDGTISYLRDGWQDFMVPMMVGVLEQCPQHERREEIEKTIIDFVDHLTGKQTIYQMIRLAEEVERRGGTPKDPLEYKRQYHEQLVQNIQGRIDDLKSGRKSPDDFLVKGSRDLLERITSAGIRCYLASGTDIEFVVEEAKLMRLEKYFGDRVYGALTNYKEYSKEKVIRQILQEFKLSGPELLVIGDGYVEIQNGRDVHAVTWGVYSPEKNRYHMNDNKKERLYSAGAHLLSRDFSEGKTVLEYLKITHPSSSVVAP